MIGGMISSTALTLLVIPAIYALWKEHDLARSVEYRDDPRLAPARAGNA